MEEINIGTIIKALKDVSSEEELLPYKDLSNGLYELPGCIICNKKFLDEYLKTINNNGLRKRRINHESIYRY